MQSPAPTHDQVVSAQLAQQIVDAAACEHPATPDHAADVACVCLTGCGMVLLMCNSHLEQLRAHVARQSANGSRFGCGTCRLDAASLDAVFEVTSLR